MAADSMTSGDTRISRFWCLPAARSFFGRCEDGVVHVGAPALRRLFPVDPRRRRCARGTPSPRRRWWGRRARGRSASGGRSGASRSLTGSFISANASSTPRVASSLSSSSSISAAVVSTSVIGSAAMTTHRTGTSAASTSVHDPRAERVGVGEEERRVPAEEERAPAPASPRGSAYEVVVALHARGTAEDGVVRAPRSPHEVEQRDARRPRRCRAARPSAATAEEGHDRQHEVRATHAVEDDERAEVDDAQRRGDDDCSERRRWGGTRSSQGAATRSNDDGERADDARELRARARGLGDGRARRAAARSESRAGARRARLATPSADELAVRVDAIAVTTCEGARQRRSCRRTRRARCPPQR